MAKLNKFAKKAAEMEAWGSLLDKAYEMRNWNMETKEDEDGNAILDADGNRVRVAPSEDSYHYATYIGWCEVIKALESMKL